MVPLYVALPSLESDTGILIASPSRAEAKHLVPAKIFTSFEIGVGVGVGVGLLLSIVNVPATV